LLNATIDQVGTVRDVLDAATGAKVASFEFDAFGKSTGASGAADIDFRDAGLLNFSPAGLHLATYRAYDPASARWLSRDPIRERGGINLYSYVDGDPVRYEDPKGLDIEMPMLEPSNTGPYPTDFSSRITPRPTYNFCRCDGSGLGGPSAQNIANTAAAGVAATGAAGAVTVAYLAMQGGSASVLAVEAAHVAHFGVQFVPMAVGDALFGAAITGLVSGLAIGTGTGTAAVVGGFIYGVTEYCRSYCEGCRR
jgi:RHS repeat-associated protein